MQVLSAAEDYQIGAHLREPPQVLHWRQLRGRVHDHGHPLAPGGGDHLPERQGALGEVGAGEKHHGGRPLREGGRLFQMSTKLPAAAAMAASTGAGESEPPSRVRWPPAQATP